MDQDSDRFLETIQGVFHQMRRMTADGQRIRVDMITMSEYINRLQVVRDELKQLKLKNSTGELPRSIYIVEYNEPMMSQYAAMSDLILNFDDSGYRSDQGGQAALVTDATVLKNRDGQAGETITIFESWPT